MLKWQQLEQALDDYWASASGVVYLVAPFVSFKTFSRMAEKLVGKDVIVITSWRSDHLLTGISSLELYPIIKEYGWHLFVWERVLPAQ